ncbi:hypothetical protein BC826DRAFT_1060115, partial [Russula brevipes]
LFSSPLQCLSNCLSGYRHPPRPFVLPFASHITAIRRPEHRFNKAVPTLPRPPSKFRPPSLGFHQRRTNHSGQAHSPGLVPVIQTTGPSVLDDRLPPPCLHAVFWTHLCRKRMYIRLNHGVPPNQSSIGSFRLQDLLSPLSLPRSLSRLSLSRFFFPLKSTFTAPSVSYFPLGFLFLPTHSRTLSPRFTGTTPLAMARAQDRFSTLPYCVTPCLSNGCYRETIASGH